MQLAFKQAHLCEFAENFGGRATIQQGKVSGHAGY